MKPYLLVPAVVLVLLLTQAASGQNIVDVRPYTPPADGAGRDRDGIGVRGGRTLPEIRSPRATTGSRAPSRGVSGAPAGGFSPPSGGVREPESAPMAPPENPSGAVRPTPGRGVYLARHEVTVRIVDGVSVTDIDQTFHNDRGRVMEGVYTCPLPARAVVDSFSIFMGDREVHGSVMARAHGRRIYEEIVRGSRDPGLVELGDSGPPTIRVRIFPIPGYGDMRVKLSYTHVQDRDRDHDRTRVPMCAIVTETNPTVDEVSLKVSARASWPLCEVTTPDYDFSGLTRGARRSWIGTFEAKAFKPEGDLEIRCQSQRKAPVLALHVHRTSGGERFFMAVVAAGPRMLRTPNLTIEGVETGDVYPRDLGSLDAGRQVLVFGKILGRGVPVAILTGNTDRGPVGLTAKASARGRFGRSKAFIAGLWAQGRIDEIRMENPGVGLPPKALAEVVDLATRHGILTPETAILAR